MVVLCSLLSTRYECYSIGYVLYVRFCSLCLVFIFFDVYKRQHLVFFFFFQAEDGIRDLVRSRGLGDVYKRQFRVLLDDWLLRPLLVAHIARDHSRRVALLDAGDLSLIHI